MLPYGNSRMSIRQSIQEWENSLARSNNVNIAERIFSAQSAKLIPWFVIGSILASLAVVHLITELGVSVGLLLLLFLGQGLCALAVYNLKKVYLPAEHQTIYNSAK